MRKSRVSWGRRGMVRHEEIEPADCQPGVEAVSLSAFLSVGGIDRGVLF